MQDDQKVSLVLCEARFSKAAGPLVRRAYNEVREGNKGLRTQLAGFFIILLFLLFECIFHANSNTSESTSDGHPVFFAMMFLGANRYFGKVRLQIKIF